MEKKEKKISIGIVGSGNVGTAFSVALASAGFDVELVSRRVKGVMIGNSINFEIVGSFGNKSHLIPIVKSVNDFTTKKDIIFICTKSHDAMAILPDIPKWLNKGGAIVTIHNAFWVEELQNLIPSDISVCMYMDISCIIDKGKTYVNNTGGITLGIYDKDALTSMHLVKSVFEKIVSTKETNNLYGFLMGRGIMNTTISLLGAISGMRLGGVLDDRNGRYLFVKLITESVELFQKIGIDILPYNGILDYYKFIKNTIPSMWYRYKMLRLICKNNRHIRSSALVDLEKGKKPEIIPQVKVILKLAKKYSHPLPFTEEVFKILIEIVKDEWRVDKDIFYNKRLVNIN